MERWPNWIAVGALLLGAAGCGSAAFQVEHDTIYVDAAPPAPQEEILEIPPSTGLVWAEGHWIWAGDDFAWVDGRWARPPAPGHAWVPAGWIRHDDRYRFVPARWAHVNRLPAFSYVHPREAPEAALSPTKPKPSRPGKCAPPKS